MSPRLGVRIIALALTLLAATAGSAAADYDSARRFLDLSPDPIERSPRLLVTATTSSFVREYFARR